MITKMAVLSFVRHARLLSVLCAALLAVFSLPTAAAGGTVWNPNGTFALPSHDTGDISNAYFVSAPWGSGSWGIEASTFTSAPYTLSNARFRLLNPPGQAYLYGKETAGEWGLVKVVVGDVWGGTRTGPIPWNVPPPLAIVDKNLTLKLDIYRDTEHLLTSDESWLMIAVNLWFSSPDLPAGTDKTGRKPLVFDLALYHECNFGGCALGSFEDADAFHYQTIIGETSLDAARCLNRPGWQCWTISLNDYIQAALAFDWQITGSIASAGSSLSLYEASALIELKMAEGAMSLDNFQIESATGSVAIPTNLASSLVPPDRPTLQWAAVPGANRYQLQLDTANPPDTLVLNSLQTRYTPSLPLIGLPHFWRVRAIDVMGNPSPWSSTQALTITSSQLSAPLRNYVTTRAVTLNWSRIDWAKTYEVQVSSSSRPFTFGVFVPAISPSLRMSLPDNRYQWRVRGRNGTQISAWSLVDSFTVDAP